MIPNLRACWSPCAPYPGQGAPTGWLPDLGGQKLAISVALPLASRDRPLQVSRLNQMAFL